MSVDRVKHLISVGDLQTLYENDQVCPKMNVGSVDLISLVEHTNGGWSDIPTLLGITNNVHANI